jgi:ABC-type uncharacterized transport system involved in gliding motility auxiliary subunit
MITNRRTLAWIALALAAILLVSLNMLARHLFPGARLDLTEDRLYTLSPGTREVLRALDEPVTLRFYLSDRLTREIPAYGAYAQRVRDLLEEYVGASGGKLVVQTFNPAPFSSVEDRAVADGLQGVPIDQGGEQIYFGLAGVNTTDDEERIPFFQMEREAFLEYDLTRMVQSLSRPKRPVVAVISTLPLDGDPMAAQMGGRPDQGLMIMEQLRQQFQVRTLAPDVADIPADANILMLVHPVGLPDATLFAVDQFALRGGKLLVLVDPHAEGAAARMQMAMMRGQPATPPVSDLDRLFSKWGVRLVPDVVVGDRRLARRVSAGASSRIQGADYLPWFTVPADFVSRTDPVTSQVSTLSFATAGVLEPREGATIAFEPLVTSSPLSMRVPVERVRGMQPDVLGILRGFQSGGQRLVVAARIGGEVDTAFPDGRPKTEGAEASEAATGPLKRGRIDAILVADTDMLEDRMWVQVQQFFGQRLAVPVSSNADFLANALDNLAGSAGLVSLRSRGVSDRPFTLVREIQQDAESRFRETEQALTEKLRETEKKLQELRGNSGDRADRQGAGTLTAAQAKAIEEGRGELLRIRADLRDVQRSLREDIESLNATIRFANIGAVPLFVALLAIVIGIVRMTRRRRAIAVDRAAA